MRDTIARGVLGGLIGTAIQAALNWTWLLIGLTSTTLTEALGRTVLIVQPGKPLSTGELAVGFFAQFLIGALYGVGLAIVLNLSGRDFWVLKGLGAGGLIGVLHLGLVPFLARMPEPVPLALAATHLTDHLLWGLVTAWVIAVLGQRVRQRA